MASHENVGEGLAAGPGDDMFFVGGPDGEPWAGADIDELVVRRDGLVGVPLGDRSGYEGGVLWVRQPESAQSDDAPRTSFINGRLVISKDEPTFYVDRQPQRLSRAPRAILDLLIDHPKVAFSVDSIIEECYDPGQNTPAKNTIEVYISIIRRKLKTPPPDLSDAIVLDRGVGYFFTENLALRSSPRR